MQELQSGPRKNLLVTVTGCRRATCLCLFVSAFGPKGLHVVPSAT